MPVITAKITKELVLDEKKAIATYLTKTASNIFGIYIDKIQTCLLSDVFLTRSMVSPKQKDFSQLSRKTSLASDKTYFNNKENLHEELIIIEVEIWAGSSQEKKKEFSKKCTSYFVEKGICLLDGVLVLFRDMNASDWIQNGISGDQSTFLEETRKYQDKGE